VAAGENIPKMQRILILGRGAAGKSTLARRLGGLAGFPVTELDQWFWQPGLLPAPRDRWVDIQHELIQTETWIIDGDLGPHDVLEPRLELADTVIILDFSLLRYAWRSIRRSSEGIDFWRPADGTLPATGGAGYSGDTAQARETAQRAIALSDEHGERWARAYALWATGIVRWRERDLTGAAVSAREALSATREFDDGICAALAIELLAWVSAGRREFGVAARLFGAARSVWREFGTAMSAFGPHMHADSLNAETETEAALGPGRFGVLAGEGAGLNVDGAIGFALEPAHRPRAPDGRGEGSPLSRREQEVAALIADGMSNRAIAQALVLSTRTVDRHVERILAKLTFTSRAQVAAWVASRSTAQVG
jgi:DNA-binding CsgD family transcriptional regulator